MKTTKEREQSDRTPVVPCLALRARECAAALGVSERTLYGWTASGAIPHVRIGGVLLYPVDEVCEWLRQQNEGGKHE